MHALSIILNNKHHLIKKNKVYQPSRIETSRCFCNSCSSFLWRRNKFKQDLFQFWISKKGITSSDSTFSSTVSSHKSLDTSRLILPCKSDCQPMFLKKQGTHSLYAKLWLVRPLIKNIHDSSHQYLSNVTFGASLALQMREEYVFEINTSKGVNSGVTQFHTQLTHVSRRFWALNKN